MQTLSLHPLLRIATLLLIVTGDGLSWLLDHSVVTEFQLDIYQTASAAGWLPWLWLATVVVTPIGEETLFRGFLFRGWQRSPRDAWLLIDLLPIRHEFAVKLILKYQNV